MGTIIQSYGPIYGESVNGTVQGRPNGSVFVPTSNTISVTWTTTADKTIRQVGGGNTGINITPAFNVSAIAQDLASYIRLAVYTDAECTTNYCRRNLTAGIFNATNTKYVGNNATAPTSEASYYFRAELWNNGTMIAATSAYEVVGE